MVNQKKFILDKPRLYIDFNEVTENDLYLLSKTDIKVDSDGNEVELKEGAKVSVFMEDIDLHGNEDNLIADGCIEINKIEKGWGSNCKWCIRIDNLGIRHMSDLE